MYVNCVYCGHRYGPKENTPVSMADVLKDHIEKCPKHPMSVLRSKCEDLEKQNAELLEHREFRDTLLELVFPDGIPDDLYKDAEKMCDE
jgi:hypothetical protein